MHGSTSLLLCMMVTRAVSGRNAATTSSAETLPSSSTPTYVTSTLPSAARWFRHLVMAGCSMAEETTCCTGAFLPVSLPFGAEEGGACPFEEGGATVLACRAS